MKTALLLTTVLLFSPIQVFAAEYRAGTGNLGTLTGQPNAQGYYWQLNLDNGRYNCRKKGVGSFQKHSLCSGATKPVAN